MFLHEFHRWNGVVSFLSGLCACWDSCVCRGFMLRPAVAPGGARVFTWVSSLEWVLFLFYLAFAPAGTRACAGVSCYRWNGVVFFQYPAFAPGGACVFTWVSSLGWCCVLIPGRCACWDWCVVLRLLRGLFFPCSSLQLCFPEFVSPKVLQTFLCRCFWKNWFPPVSLLIFSSQFVSGLSTAIWLLLSDRSACCTRAFAWVSCFAFYGFFEAFLLRRFSATVFFRGCLSRRFSKRFGADVFSKIFRPQVSLPIYSSKISFPKFPCKCYFFPFFLVQKFFANGFFEAIFPVICLQIFSWFFFSRISLPLFAANCCRSFFADV